MKILFFSVTMFFSLYASAYTCIDSDNGLVSDVAGKVVYSLGGENCLADTCHQQMIKEFDRCLNSKVLLEFACGKGEVLEKEMMCSSSQVCSEGACR